MTVTYFTPEGLTGKVESISACPPIETGSGRVVLTTVSHLNDFVFTLTLSDSQGNSDNLGVTGYHKFYTEDRGWVSASELTQGEVVRTAYGDATVTGLVRNPGTFTVYNMTVEADHVYYVGDLTALVHNAGCFKDIGFKNSGPDWANKGPHVNIGKTELRISVQSGKIVLDELRKGTDSKAVALLKKALKNREWLEEFQAKTRQMLPRVEQELAAGARNAAASLQQMRDLLNL